MDGRTGIALLGAVVISLAPGVAVAQEGSAGPGSPATPSVSSLVTPGSGTASVNGLEMYYEVHGTGEPLVLLHGALVGIDLSWGQLMPMLAETRQVIAVEQQGHWRTPDIDRPLSYAQMADDTAALLGQLGVEQADILGYSMGGTIALELAIRHPDAVRRLVVVSAGFAPEGTYPIVVADIERLRPEDLIGSGLPESYAEVAPDPDGWSGLVERIKELERTWEGIPAEQVAGIEAPTLVVIGDSDAVTPEHAVQLFRLLGGGVSGDNEPTVPDRFAILPGLSHVAVGMTIPTWFPHVVQPFLDEPASTERGT
ncbi:MAG: alpha/beta fold hydrolase [Chloroflexi bacterium]|nr:alpha/beta fold hydrolase [Chloroflexota bacterium]